MLGKEMLVDWGSGFAVVCSRQGQIQVLWTGSVDRMEGPSVRQRT